MANIPDPTADLDWTYNGSIIEHFARNAEAHPERVCVVETKTSETPERQFTYKQIYEASNILAHHLTEAGVTNGDVVMICAHRSVDLVVAIMGTLLETLTIVKKRASGATFSVLDLLYPPSRQQVYLEVARPCALVNIAKASNEAGPLAPLVRRYIDEELNLKTEVPPLRIGDDGVLAGGEVNGADLFAQVRAKAASRPDVIVGPDSNPTFTSGSEGKPKGVPGRHYSLCKYFPWMAERFNLTSDSKFTLLSGISHNPEDIQHEKLAEWMREHKPTVTHLTPAMGQILVGGATAEFPSLDRAFFVGDVLTTRDCRSLRKLAENANIVNMYGTTETQRAVSYFEIPSHSRDPNALDALGNTVPAGKGIQNVQLLVIDRQDRNKICGVGEVGEIFFITSWFVDPNKWTEAYADLGKDDPRLEGYVPRDRLYRTGDLGRYLESDDVEPTGRADDQVKIRGFRIELNEIDSNLSQNPLIRDCKTLVRRDKNEEPILVSYIVPELNEWPKFLKTQGLEDVEDEGTDIGPTKVYFKRFRRMQTEVHDHLKGRLPAYAVPTTYITLEKLPLNPNGKVDKPNLPFPDITEQTEDATEEDLKRWESLSATEQTVATNWSELIPGLNAKTITPQNDFFDLGGHSLLAQQMLLVVRKTIGANVSINTLYEHPSLAGFSAHIDRQLKGGAAGESEEDKNPEYARSLEELLKGLPSKAKPVVFLTGATGFLGAYLIKDILQRTSRQIQLIAHVRSPNLGIEASAWANLAQTVDVVIHNGAAVHWVKRYADMKTANVNSTIDAMRLCNEGKPKTFTFVSSTSVLDTDHYVNLSDKQVSTGQGSILEEDDMMGSRTGLGTGYGQTKWVSEQLVREAGRRGLRGTVARPGYILGDIETGVCNTDDFLIRMLKGCIQLGVRPHIVNTVNAVPVNHVANVVVACALNPLPGGVHVAHITGHPRLRMNEYLSSLEYYGYKSPEVEYTQWKDELENYVTAGGQEKGQEQHALMPLYHFCVNDLPANTRAPELDDSNTVKILKEDAEHWTGIDESSGYGISRVDIGRFLRFLVETQFVSWPTGRGRPFPEANLTAAQLETVGAVGGRGVLDGHEKTYESL
ncbi:L-aminoadipate-semialdehyde dehydrogenase large subunit [Fusarium tricinctum]|uniref:L-aminoadipate-semialdehyde dehydrogenase large subunit n=1 Tax=Fusarium tricinctum TaxID=61284 RepID=A0A8K0RUY2_9HYPO|nr:L-aminoadipate-semialdehyde dehydrogenase large subunit [Fusarium tricinctum]